MPINVEQQKDDEINAVIRDSMYYYGFCNSTDPMSFSDNATGRYIDVNQAFLDLLDYEKQEVIGKSMLELGLFEDGEDARKALEQLLTTGCLHNYRVVIKTKNGSVKYGEISTCIFSCAGLSFRFTVMQDKTDRVEYEHALWHNKKHLQMMIENISDVIGITDKDGIITYRSPNCEATFGHKPEDIIGHSAFNYIHPDDLERLKQNFSALKSGGKNISKEGEIRYRCKDGSYKLLHLTASNLLENEFINGILITYRDITAQRKAERLAAEETARYQALLASTNNMVWVVEQEHYTLTLFNSSLAKYFKKKYNIDLQHGMTVSDLFSKERAQLWYSLYARCAAEGRFQYNYQTESMDLFLNLSFSPLIVEDKLIGISIFGEDVTERVKYRHELEVTNKKLAQRFVKSIGAISKIGELKDSYNAGHQRRVQGLACAIALELNLPNETVENIALGALIHDIGKLYIPAELLNKPGKITDLEYKILQTHAEYGYEVANEIDFPWQIPAMIHQHHERLDGSGYPKGLIGDQILMESRILSVADVVEAISYHRPYRPALGIDAALEEITTFREKKYDSRVVDTCLKLFKEKGFEFTN